MSQSFELLFLGYKVNIINKIKVKCLHSTILNLTLKNQLAEASDLPEINT